MPDPPDPVDPPGPVAPLRTFDLSGLPARVEVEQDDADTLAFADVLGEERPEGFGLAVVGSGGATAIGTADALVVQGRDVGDATLQITFSATGYADAEATLAVRVVPGVCPPPAPPGARDFFPATEGATATYTLKTFQSGTLQRSETLTSTVRSVRCRRGVRLTDVAFDVDGEARETVTARENAAGVVAFTTPALGLFQTTATFDRYAPAFAAERVLVPTGLCASAAMAFVDGVGFDGESATCDAAGGLAGRRIERQP